ncbi:MAG TPA: hypothetical protein VGK13_02055 [Methanocellaceae archaeon]
MYSFTSDDRGVTEPYTDLPSLAILAVGLMLFGFLILSAYTSYASSAYYVAIKGDLREVAMAIESDPAIISEGHPGVIIASNIDKADLSGYGRPGAVLRAIIEIPGYRWEIGESSKGVSASYRMPITVVLNDARSLPGTLTITAWER